jgi:hydrogenase maturation protein HypF
MDIYHFPHKTKKSILALGAESDGNFCFFERDKIYFSEKFGDLLEEKNWQKYQKAVLEFLKKNKFKPNIILTDIHPLYLTSAWGEALSKKYKARHVQIQHHIAHIFSSIGEQFILNTKYQIPNTIYGIATDGTGYGTDEKIWGGEVFQISNSPTCHSRGGGNPVANCLICKSNFPLHKNSGNSINSRIQRIGHLENQILIGGDLAVREPARMLISILDKVISPSPPGRGWSALGGPGESKGELQRKNYIYRFVKKHYTKNEFELIHNQLKQNFNCLETSSTGRILDAVSLLLGFCGNERKYKHEPIALLEANSGKPYADLKPKITLSQGKQVLSTTFLFEYLVKNLHKDKKRLATTAQLYIAQGLYEIIKKNIPNTRYKLPNNFIAGGIANNKIISDYLISKGAYASKKIYPVKLSPDKLFNRVPRGDAGLSFGQVIYYLFSQ